MNSLFAFDQPPSAKGELEEILESHLPEQLRIRAENLLKQALADSASKARFLERRTHVAAEIEGRNMAIGNQDMVLHNLASVSDLVAITNESVVEDDASVVNEDLKERKRKFEKTLDKLEFLKSFKIPENVKFTEGARCWIRDSLKPTMKCLAEHCDGNTQKFVEKFGDRKVSFSKFGNVCKSVCHQNS